MQLNRTKSFIALVLGTLVSFAVHAHETKKVMGLKMPESAIAAKDGRVFLKLASLAKRVTAKLPS